MPKEIDILAILAVILVIMVAGFSYLMKDVLGKGTLPVISTSPGVSTGSPAKEESPRISIAGTQIIDYTNGKAYIRILGDTKKSYTVDIVVSGDIQKTYKNVTIKPFITDFPIDIPTNKLLKGCRLKISIIYQGKTITTKTLYIGP